MTRKHRLEIALVVLIVITAAFYLRWDVIPSFPERHVDAFEENYEVDVGDPGRWFSAWALGDGQAYALIGVDPTGRTLAQRIPEAGYRFARAGYGWAVWAVALGQPDVVPYVLAAVGALAVMGVVFLAIRLRDRLGPRSWLIVLNPALYIGFAADTSEPMGILLLAAVLAGRGWLAAGLIGLTRPTFLVALWGRRRHLATGVAAALALAFYSFLAFGVDAMIPSGGRLGLPLHAYLQHLSVGGLLLAIAAIGTLAIGVRVRDWAWILAGTFVLCFGLDVLRDPVNAWRAAGFLPVLWAFGVHYRIGSKGSLQPEPTAADVA
ncbi:MAG: hypothetical protein ACLFWH_01940 [Actinomycetota bacterium]